MEGCIPDRRRSGRSHSFTLVSGVALVQVNEAELFQLGAHVIDIETQFTGSETGTDFRFSFFTLLRGLQNGFQLGS
jgi:broad specificity polyphosphatase/5'/3'-nucleotidase SurE